MSEIKKELKLKIPPQQTTKKYLYEYLEHYYLVQRLHTSQGHSYQG